MTERAEDKGLSTTKVRISKSSLALVDEAIDQNALSMGADVESLSEVQRGIMRRTLIDVAIERQFNKFVRHPCEPRIIRFPDMHALLGDALASQALAWYDEQEKLLEANLEQLPALAALYQINIQRLAAEALARAKKIMRDKILSEVEE